MSIADKQVLLNKISSVLGDELTATRLNSTMEKISDSISEFLVERAPDANPSVLSDELLSAFLDAKRIEGRSEKTIERYRYCITRMLKCLNTPVASINVFHVRKYLMEEKARGSSDRTVEGYRNVMSSFFGWLHREGLLEANPVANIGPVKCMKKVRQPFSDTDFEKLKENCGSARNAAILFFLLFTGCRISEVCALNREDVDFHNMECTVLGKGNKQRKVFLNDVTAMMVARYLSERTDDSTALFAGKGTDRMTPGGIRFMLKSISEDAGVENVHPHRFRRTLATNLINRGMAIQDVAFILGHEKLDTTMKYVSMSEKNVKNSYDKYA